MAKHDDKPRLINIKRRMGIEQKLLYIVIILQIIEIGLRIYGK